MMNEKMLATIGEKLARNVTRKLAHGVLVKGVLVSNNVADTCQDIVNTGYRDELFKDIVQNVTLLLWQTLRTGEVVYNDTTGAIEYTITTTINRSGEEVETSSYLLFIKEVRATINSAKMVKGNPKNKLAEISKVTDNGEIVWICDTSASARITLANMVEIEQNKDIEIFKKRLLEIKPKKAEIYNRVIDLLLLELTQKEIAKKLEVSKSTLNRYVADIRALWKSENMRVTIATSNHAPRLEMNNNHGKTSIFVNRKARPGIMDFAIARNKAKTPTGKRWITPKTESMRFVDTGATTGATWENEKDIHLFISKGDYTNAWKFDKKKSVRLRYIPKADNSRNYLEPVKEDLPIYTERILSTGILAHSGNIRPVAPSKNRKKFKAI